jgi:hypothetical protein
VSLIFQRYEVSLADFKVFFLHLKIFKLFIKFYTIKSLTDLLVGWCIDESLNNLQISWFVGKI